MKRLRAWFITVIVIAVAIRILWWSIEPIIPYLVAGLFLVTIFGLIFYRRSRW